MLIPRKERIYKNSANTKLDMGLCRTKPKGKTQRLLPKRRTVRADKSAIFRPKIVL